MSTRKRSRNRRLPPAALMLAALGVLGLTALPQTARADCGFTSGQATTVTFNAGTITLTPSETPGTVLWTSNTAAPANPPVLHCDGNTNGGIVNTIAASTPVNGQNTLIPTGIPGISYRLEHPDVNTLLALYPNYPTTSGTFNITTKLQLVYTGPYLPPNNSTLNGELSRWKVDICNNPRFFFGFYVGCNGTVAPRPVEIFNINATLRILVPTCDIAAGSVNKTVTLPSIGKSQFSGQGSTAGKTPFSLQLTNCPTNLGVFITLNSSNAQAGATGVIAPTGGAGYASGIGVQVLKADGSTPVSFGTAINTGTTNSSNYDISLFARYYQTGNNVSAGNVKAIATYTLTYQ